MSVEVDTSAGIEVAYYRVRELPVARIVARTVEAGTLEEHGLLVDLDSQNRIIGIEKIGTSDPGSAALTEGDYVSILRCVLWWGEQ